MTVRRPTRTRDLLPWALLLSAAACGVRSGARDAGDRPARPVPPAAAPALAATRPAADGGECRNGDELPRTGWACPGLDRYDKLMADFMRDKHVPGAALTISYRGRIVYERGFGFAVKAKRACVTPGSLFRVASISKPITAVAILKLAEENTPVGGATFSLDSKAFPIIAGSNHFAPGTPAGDLLPGEPPDQRLNRITVRQLLHHTGGWDPGMSIEPSDHQADVAEDLDTEPPLDADQLVAYMIRRRLDFTPGSRFAYSDVGYTVLGRVVKAVSGQSYEQYVTTRVLRPLGLTDMRLGRTLREDAAPGEVRYYAADGREAPAVVGKPLGRPVPRAYGGWSLEAMDSEAGWLATATDLVKFADALAAPGGMKTPGGQSVLRPETIGGEMFAPRYAYDSKPADFKSGRLPPRYYACGWFVEPVTPATTVDPALDPLRVLNISHDGLLRGSSSGLVVHRADDLCWAVLFNTDVDRSGYGLADVIGPLLQAVPTIPEVRQALTAPCR